MIKSIVGLLPGLLLIAGCAAPQQSASPQASAASQTTAVASVDSAPTQNNDDYETIFVPPPAGSLLGGGSVRVPKRKVTGSDETALLGNIRLLNAAAGSKDERPFVINAVSRVTGVSEKQLQSQQDRLRLRFGELCAINSIARGNSAKVQEIATLKSSGRTWTDLARANGVSVATVAQMARNASEMTADTYSKNADRQRGGNRKVKDLGVRSVTPHSG